MSSKVFLPPLARLLMSSLFVWDGIVQAAQARWPFSAFSRLEFNSG